MAKDVVITPASALIDFKDNGGNVDAYIQLDDLGNLKIYNPGGDISLGATTSDIYVGDGITAVDIIFEQNGNIRALSGKTLGIGQSNSFVSVYAPTTFSANVTAANVIVNSFSRLGTVTSGTWNGSSISTTYTDAKIVSVSNTAPVSASTAAGAVTVSLLASGVTAGTYGSATSEGVFTVDTYGRITSASNVTSSVAIGSQVTGLGTNVANFLAYPTSANLISVVADETGSGSLVFATTPTLVTPILGLATGTSVMLSANIGAAAGNVSGNFTVTGNVVSSNVTVSSRVNFGNTTTTVKAYQFYNGATASLDTVFV